MSRTFTLEELKAFSGAEPEKPIYMSVRRTVFDVTPGKDFYGPEGPYAVFAGRECANALATMQIEEAACHDDLSGLGADRIKILEDWEKKFRQKYQVVGQLQPSQRAVKADAVRSSFLLRILVTLILPALIAYLLYGR